MRKSYLKVINLKTLGSAGGKARAAKLSDTQRRAAAKKANRARWDKYYLEHPEKIRPKKKRKGRVKSESEIRAGAWVVRDAG